MTSGDVQALGESSSWKRMLAAVEERKRWEATNPDLAADWNAALLEDEQWRKRKEFERRDRHWDAEIPKALERAGFPLDAIEALRDLRETPAVVAARRYQDAPVALDGRFLVFFGPKGLGKTTAAALVARDVLRKWTREHDMGERDYFTTGPVEFVLAATFARLSGYDREDKAWFERMCSVRLLVLDDLGSEHLNEFGKAMLDELLTRRHADRKRTVITTNLDKVAFAKRIGERLFDRISTSGVSCQSTGDSMRKRSNGKEGKRA